MSKNFDEGLAVGFLLGKKKGGCGPAETDTIGGKGFKVNLPTYDPRIIVGKDYNLVPIDTETFVLSYNSTLDKWSNQNLNSIYAEPLHSFGFVFDEQMDYSITAPAPTESSFSTFVESI